MPRATFDRSTELRKVGDGPLFQLFTALDASGDWARVMIHVPIDPTHIDREDYNTKYTLEHIRIIENHAKICSRNPTAIFLDEWGTSGRVRPTLETLQKLVGKLKLYKAMVEMAHLVGDPEPPRPNDGPAIQVDTNITRILFEESIENELNDLKTITDAQLMDETTYNNNIDNHNNRQIGRSRELPNFLQPEGLSTREMEWSNMIKFSQDLPIEVVSSELPIVLNQCSVQEPFPAASHLQVQLETSSGTEQTSDDSIGMPAMVSSINKSTGENPLAGINYSYSDLKRITRSFAIESDVDRGIGGRIGKGGFGEVYVGFISGQPIAVKRLLEKNMESRSLLKQFQAEVQMTYYRHINVVQVLGYSEDGPEKLIVSEFISGGNLRQRLDQKTLNVTQRFKIISGTATGLQYLHDGTEKKLIHKDVKSLNILLTESCIPKLCDFGLTRMQNTDTTRLMGTEVYVAPEVYRHDITPKMDVFSYGIVLLEILTGLKPVMKFSNNTSKNIQTYVQEEIGKQGTNKEKDITPLLDSTIVNWPMANSLYFLAEKCLAEWKERPETKIVCAYLQFQSQRSPSNLCG